MLLPLWRILYDNACFSSIQYRYARLLAARHAAVPCVFLFAAEEDFEEEAGPSAGEFLEAALTTTA